MEYFDSIAHTRLKWRQKYAYYNRLLEKYIQFYIPQNVSVLEIGCCTGELLASLKPKRGVGIDYSQKMIDIAQQNHKQLEFHQGDLETLEMDETFDYIILTNNLGYFHDIQEAIHRLKKFCKPTTRIVVSYPSNVWQPILKLSENLGWRMKWPEKHWLSMDDIGNLFDLEGFETVKKDYRILFPVFVPLLSTFLNRFIVNLPIIRHLAINLIQVLKPTFLPRQEQAPSTTVLIPCRNEKGNIEEAIKRLPTLGPKTEVLFVEGHSKDGTYEECLRVKESYPDHDIKVMRQKGKGKGNAVREGFEKATGDILMILDADLTVPPEMLPKFYQAIASGKGEFINGSRLVYRMEKKAMQFLNQLANFSFGYILTYLIGQSLKDTLCGTKVLWREDYLKIEAGRSYFGDFDPFGDFDLLFGAAKLNLKIVEIPVKYKDRTYGSTQISRFRHGWLLIQMTGFAMRKMKFI